ncbi:hypothetical protein Ava_3095 [Trichormus variabilis ATCC 29413]|uniref:Uncharacterized protein n=2 Tax=Anabaena variabilis TaxID=264691 RepID=Q3M8I2_TRIV2|nr:MULTISPECIES: hypothetical protein [Nostocaceae]ABA22704.1 hypothetical protein Ava_3095 [Trichormus variabilis ATCC 29413]MBC1215057.1 hypothetical protein [Trichormus variabilis ARAD]MBC1254979.1 hypothetical protein [Trichormus variabilis V5]MBC1267958.1 hypothetical protein [Trichormus variabilis FSR]MBC1303727.1 hypothetical protein [Trichormus variabilis N2B]
MTIKDLKQQASDLGLTSEYVKTFGKLSAKATWQSAIDAHLKATTTEPVIEPTPSVAIDDPWLSEPTTECPTVEPSNVVEYHSYQLCLPYAVEPDVVPIPTTTTTPTHSTHTPPFAVVLVVAIMVLLGQVIAIANPIVTYLYKQVRSAIARRRDEHRRRQQWYNELRQLMTT